MAATGLPQIDENTSLSEASVGEQPVLPNLLRRHMPQPENAGEKTPEVWLTPYDEATPEAWPSTPTPHNRSIYMRNGFALPEYSPEPWPECTPSFRVDTQLPVNASGMQVVMPVPGVDTSMMPMWMGQSPAQYDSVPIPYAFPGAVFPGSMFNMVNMGVPGNPLPPSMASCPQSTKARTEMRATEEKAATASKKPAPAPKSSAAGSECPVAVYVDLSALRERGSLARRGVGGRK